MAEIKIDLKDLKSRISSSVRSFSDTVKGFSDNISVEFSHSDARKKGDTKNVRLDIDLEDVKCVLDEVDIELNNVFRTFDESFSHAMDDVDSAIDEDWMPDDDTFDRIKVKCTEVSSSGLFAEKNRIDRIFRTAFK